MKVTPHVFWLDGGTARSPRILGFLPIPALLGAQFLCLATVVHAQVACRPRVDRLRLRTRRDSGAGDRRLAGLRLPAANGKPRPAVAVVADVAWSSSNSSLLGGDNRCRDRLHARRPPTAFLATAARRLGADHAHCAASRGVRLGDAHRPDDRVQHVATGLRGGGVVPLKRGASAVPRASCRFVLQADVPAAPDVVWCSEIAGRRGLFARPLRLYFVRTDVAAVGHVADARGRRRAPGRPRAGRAGSDAVARAAALASGSSSDLLARISTFMSRPAERVSAGHDQLHQLVSLTGAAVGLLAIGGVFDASLRRLLPGWLADRVPKPCEMMSVVHISRSSRSRFVCRVRRDDAGCGTDRSLPVWPGRHGRVISSSAVGDAAQRPASACSGDRS